MGVTGIAASVPAHQELARAINFRRAQLEQQGFNLERFDALFPQGVKHVLSNPGKLEGTPREIALLSHEEKMRVWFPQALRDMAEKHHPEESWRLELAAMVVVDWLVDAVPNTPITYPPLLTSVLAKCWGLSGHCLLAVAFMYELGRPEPVDGDFCKYFEARFSKYVPVQIDLDSEWPLGADCPVVVIDDPICSFAEVVAWHNAWRPVDPSLARFDFYRALEQLWDTVLSRRFLDRYGDSLARFLIHFDQGYSGPCDSFAQWQRDTFLRGIMNLWTDLVESGRYAITPEKNSLTELWHNDIVRCVDARNGRTPPPAPPASSPDLPPPWLDDRGRPMVSVFDAKFPVYYGWIYLMPEGHDGDGAGRAFDGQRNGLIGVQRPPLVALRTGVHTAEVPLTVYVCDEEPAYPVGSWGDLVEASFVVEPGQSMCLCDWEGELAEPLALAPGCWRARYGAAYFGQGANKERYALALWPEPQVREDAVSRDKSAAAREWHALAQGAAG